MNWIDDIVTGLIDTYNTNDPYELCNFLNINIIKVNPKNMMLNSNDSLYIRNYNDQEIIFIRNDLSKNYEDFYLRHELGHAILHPNIKNSLNESLVCIDKLEKQANYFSLQLSQIKFDVVELKQLTLEQISCYLEIPLHALKQIFVC